MGYVTHLRLKAMERTVIRIASGPAHLFIFEVKRLSTIALKKSKHPTCRRSQTQFLAC